MKIVYIAKHGSGGNQDENAIHWALTQLGHEVTCFQEQEAANVIGRKFDFCLIHKCEEIESLKEIAKTTPVVSWFFDLVHTTDADLRERSLKRVDWAHQVEQIAHTGFFTDGDWVARNRNKRIWLMQGADERYAGRGNYRPEIAHDIVFTGITYGTRRSAHIQHLQNKWGDKFKILGDRNPRHRLHQQALADLVNSCKIVIAPDGPNTHSYWSNRVYLISGFGGFLLHPRCDDLRLHYDAHELTMYNSWSDLDDQIEYFLERPKAAKMMSDHALNRTTEQHLYRHRVAELVNVMENRL